MRNATYARVKDGTWGLRICSDTPPQAGEAVKAVRKDGHESTQFVGEYLYGLNGVHFVRIEKVQRKPQKVTEVYRTLYPRRSCGYPGCTGTGHCDECTP